MSQSEERSFLEILKKAIENAKRALGVKEREKIGSEEDGNKGSGPQVRDNSGEKSVTANEREDKSEKSERADHDELLRDEKAQAKKPVAKSRQGQVRDDRREPARTIEVSSHDARSISRDEPLTRTVEKKAENGKGDRGEIYKEGPNTEGRRYGILGYGVAVQVNEETRATVGHRGGEVNEDNRFVPIMRNDSVEESMYTAWDGREEMHRGGVAPEHDRDDDDEPSRDYPY